MSFSDGDRQVSVLYQRGARPRDPVRSAPAFFADLRLDQVCAALCHGRDEYDLTPFFYQALHDVDAVHYRQAVMRDLRQREVLALVAEFAKRMRQVRTRLSYVNSKLRYGYQKQRWLLAALDAYADAVTQLDDDLSGAPIESEGLCELRAYVTEYRRSQAFQALVRDTAEVLEALSEVLYTVHIEGDRVSVAAYDGELDLTSEVEAAFAKFRQGDVADYRVKFADPLELNHVEAHILGIVAELFPGPFLSLSRYCTTYRAALDETVIGFDREVQFYLAYVDYIGPLEESGLRFTYPGVSVSSKDTNVASGFDLALAAKLVHDHLPVVCNDLSLSGDERVLVITGPNQGGKTTFVRMFGQLHHLAALGLSVPGTEVNVFLPDQLFTHFEREESLSTLRSKFEDELYRMRQILDLATANSVLIMNESLTATTLSDAVTVGSWVLQQVIDRQMLCACVTFVDELASLSDNVVSMMSTVEQDDPTIRTFRVVRKPADGLAHAVALARKYGLGYDELKQRVSA